MARLSMNELLTEATTTLADNTTGEISAADVRFMFENFINAIKPAYGYLSKPVTGAVLVGTTPIALAYSSAYDSDATQTTGSAPLGTITRAEKGSSSFTFSASVDCQAGRIVTFILYKDNNPLTWSASATGGGTGKPIAVTFSGIDFSDPAGVYDVRVVCDTANTTVNIGNVAFVLKVDPVTSYV
jgi:hypothetical protein